MIKEIKLNRIKKDINDYLNTLSHKKYCIFDVCFEECYYDINGNTIIHIKHHAEHNGNNIRIKRENIPHCQLEMEDYKDDLLKKFTKCDYKIRYK